MKKIIEIPKNIMYVSTQFILEGYICVYICDISKRTRDKRILKVFHVCFINGYVIEQRH